MATLTTLDEQCARGNLNPPRANGAHSFRYDEEWLRSPRARPLSLSLPLQYGNITADAVYHYFDNLLPDSPQVRDRIVRRYQARSKQPFDLLAEVGRDSVGAVTLLPPGEEAHWKDYAGRRWTRRSSPLC
ncbi:HipA N-terminal domain-containing protein [Klebsiella pneumoniae]|uniref:HipA N-terminal domain-containing protein n=1 Tax=Klebsiella pneumoniae TaxID=573 RepID=A0A927HNQ5_KLEPN|nr:HipA N-terminal domain-containing protein [Klebsiella pneumoniae]